MCNTSHAEIQIELKDNELSAEEQHQIIEQYLHQLSDIPDIQVEQPKDKGIASNAKAISGLLPEILLTPISGKSAKLGFKLALDFMRRKMKGNMLEITVTRGDKTIIIKTNDEDLDESFEKAKALFDHMGEEEASETAGDMGEASETAGE